MIVSEYEFHVANDKRTTAVFLSDSRRKKILIQIILKYRFFSIDFVRDFVSALSILWTLSWAAFIGCWLHCSSLCS